MTSCPVSHHAARLARDHCLAPERVGDPVYGGRYRLKEAEVLHAGERLGPAGGRVVGEVLVGIIDADPESFRSVDPGWQPTLSGRRAGSFGLADMLVPPR